MNNRVTWTLDEKVWFNQCNPFDFLIIFVFLCSSSPFSLPWWTFQQRIDHLTKQNYVHVHIKQWLDCYTSITHCGISNAIIDRRKLDPIKFAFAQFQRFCRECNNQQMLHLATFTPNGTFDNIMPGMQIPIHVKSCNVLHVLHWKDLLKLNHYTVVSFVTSEHN